MGPALPFNWQDELEHLRREQNPSKYPPRAKMKGRSFACPSRPGTGSHPQMSRRPPG